MAQANRTRKYDSRIDILKMIDGKVPADSLILGGSIVNVATGEIIKTGVAIKSGRIGAIGDYAKRFRGESTRVFDAEGLYLAPGFVDAHLHVESSMLSPVRFSRLMAEKGVTTVFYDPHEIANVSGLSGVSWMVEEMNKTPMNGFLTVPSCIPASSPSLETTGGKFGLEEIKEALDWETTAALGEMMNFPGVLNREQGTIAKIKEALKRELPVEGHASGLAGEALDGYGSAGVDSDHESVTKSEGIERARKGFWTYVREGSGWADVSEVIRSLTETDISPTRFCLVTDDRDAGDLLEEGGVDHVIRRTIEEGVDPVEAIRMATINPATRFRMDDNLGSLSPGRIADVNFVSDLGDLSVENTLLGGEPIKEIDWPETEASSLTDTVRVSEEINSSLFDLSPDEKRFGIRVHGDDILTDRLDLESDSYERDELDFCTVLERHKLTGNVGRTMVEGFDLDGGAIASTVAHDSHNLIVLGKEKTDMAIAANHLSSIGGGQVVVRSGEVEATVELPIAGLMSDARPEEVAESLADLKRAIEKIGCEIDQPLMILSSLALAVIPEVRITDKGLVDVNNQELIA